MHQLKGLIWKAYKVRLRSPLTTTLDLGGPIVIVVVFLVLKLVLTSLSLTVDPDLNSTPLFRNSDRPLEPQSDIKRHLCTKVLFYSSAGSTSPLASAIVKQCGLELVASTSRDDLLKRLDSSLQGRVVYRKGGTSLERSNSTGGCFTLDGAKEPSYQLGIVVSNEQGTTSFELHMTDLASSSVIYQPYVQGSTYNEYRIPHSDLNSGLYLIQICLAKAVADQSGRTDSHQNIKADNNNGTVPVTTPSTPTNVTSKPNNNGTKPPGPTNLDSKWRIKSYPYVTSSLIVPNLFLALFLAANFCNAITTVLRIAEDNETGLHHYIRASGVPACRYWLSQMIVIVAHLVLQNLILAILLAIPTSNILLDPIQEMNIAIRWALLFSYSFSINAHAMFFASLFDKTSHALLVTCLLAVTYCTYPFIFHVQFTPYSYSPFGILLDLVLFNPVSCFEALMSVLHSIYMQTGEPLHWGQLHMRIPGGGICDWSIGALWALLLIQSVLWFMITILADHLFYSSSKISLALTASLANEMCCCNCIQPEVVEDTGSAMKTKSSQASKKISDPNRICCSMRHVSVAGPTIMMAHARGNPLKMDDKQVDKLNKAQDSNQEQTQVVSKAVKYVVNRTKRSLDSAQYRAGSAREEPILIDEAMLQHIVWQKTSIQLENISLDFRFNQISFVLGQTDVKELLFAALMGLRILHSGYIVLDGTKYTPANLNLARSQVGYLGERDIFLNELTIYENLQFFGSVRDGSYSQYDSESLFVLNLLHLSSRKDSLPSSLTSRSARKLALGVAAVGHTKILLLVEPTLGLRWKPRCQVLNLLKKYKSIRSIVVDTSDVDEASAFGDRIVLLKNGKADLDGTPERLKRKLCCGYWLVFEPLTAATTTTNGKGPTINDIGALEKLTSQIFKNDKLELLDSTRRSVYQQMVGSKVSSAGSQAVNQKKSSKLSGATKTPVGSGVSSKAPLDDDKLHKNTVILKVQHTLQTPTSLCTILKMFAQHHQLHGFRLAELTYESLEDILVLRMSKGAYPDLPPDLLLSLQHRTRASKSNNPPQVSVRRCESELQVPKVARPMFGEKFFAILKDRVSQRWELMLTLITIISSLTIACLGLYALRESLIPPARDTALYKSNSWNRAATPTTSAATVRRSAALGNGDEFAIDHEWLEDLFEDRIGFYVMIDKQDESASAEAYLRRWTHNKRLTGLIMRDTNESDFEITNRFIRTSRDLAISLVVFDLKSGQTTVLYESNLAHALAATIKTIMEYQLTNKGTRSSHGFNRLRLVSRRGQSYRTKQFQYQQPWHGIIRGYQNRRFFYGLGFALAEGIATGIMVLAPIRHRSESREMKLRVNYWFAMATFDLAISLVLVMGYVVLILLFEWTYSATGLFCILIVFILYKLGAIPFAYLVSLAVETSLSGFLFILLVFVTVSWVFCINLKTFIEWVLFGQGYLYTITNWVIIATPINAVIETLTNINHVHYMNELCKLVPAYTATSNLVPLEGEQRETVTDKLISKVGECLRSGKEGISTSVMHEQTFGILWDVYLIILFDIIVWTFLIFSERVFGLLSRRFTSAKTSYDPMKSIIRSTDIHGNLFKWDREKDRLVSEYIRCINEAKYVKHMVTNCVYLRIWLKPMSDDSMVDKRMLDIVEPLVVLGQPRQDIQIELKTTLQIFFRIGSETSKCRLSRVQLIETFTKFVKLHEDKVVKFAIVDWTRETLYKILLHGHYNTKCAPTIT